MKIRSSNVETFVWDVFIQYIRFAVAVSSYSLLNTNIENQTSRSISFYSWKRHLTLTEILNSFEQYRHEWWSYFEINSFSYSYDSTTNSDDVIQKKKINFRVIIILVNIDECWDRFSTIFHRDAFARIKTSKKRICWKRSWTSSWLRASN